MNVVQSLLNLFKKNETPSINEVPEGFCPNCWGRTEYGGKFYEAVKNENVDVNSTNPNIGWVQEYANKHLASIHLEKENENLVCSTCKVTYKSTE